jgi:outer membrane receptor protein involved in Fe transport
MIDDVDANQVLVDEGWCLYGKMPDNTQRNPPLSDAMCSLQESRVHRDANGVVTEIVTGPINRASTRVAGIDAKVSYQFPHIPLGNFSIAANYTQLLDYRSRQFPTDPLENTVYNQNPRARFNATLNWNDGSKWNASLYMYLKSGGRSNRWNGCSAFDDGFVPSPGTNCQDTDPASPTYGQSTVLLRENRAARAYFNGSIGYQFTEWLKANLYVSNIIDEMYGDPYCGDFAYCIDDPVGREISGEIVVKF